MKLRNIWLVRGIMSSETGRVEIQVYGGAPVFRLIHETEIPEHLRIWASLTIRPESSSLGVATVRARQWASAVLTFRGSRLRSPLAAFGALRDGYLNSGLYLQDRLKRSLRK